MDNTVEILSNDVKQVLDDIAMQEGINPYQDKEILKHCEYICDCGIKGMLASFLVVLFSLDKFISYHKTQ